MFLLNYFDLNKRIGRGPGAFGILHYKGPVAPTPPGPESPGLSAWEQMVMYLGTVVGVFFSSAVSQSKNGAFSGFNFTLSIVVLSAIIGLFIIPVIYEKLSIKPNTPFIVRLGLFVQHGVFWHVLFDSIGKTIAS